MNPKRNKRAYVTDIPGKQINEIAEEMNASVGWVTKVISSFLTTTASQVLRTYDQPLTNDRVNHLAFNPAFYEIISGVLRDTPVKEPIDSITILNGSHSVKSRESEGY